MSLKKSLAITAGLLVSFSSAASNLSLAFNNDNIDLGYELELQQALKLKGDYLQTIDNGFTLGSTFFELGAKGMMMHTDFGEGSSIAFGGLAGLRLTEALSLETELHFSPEILAFGDTNNYTQWIARVSYAVMPTAHFFVEYNSTTIEYDKRPDEDLTGDVLVGLKWVF